MGYRHDRDEILRASIDAVLDDGLSRLTFGRLAKRLGINDRSVVYYFPTKDDLLRETVMALGERLQPLLAEAFGTDLQSRDALLRQAWPILSSPEAEPLFRVYFELVGLAAGSIAPFDQLAPAIVAEWVRWLEPRLDVPEASRPAEALAALAVVDGLLLMKVLLTSEAADAAARRLGIC